VGLIEILWDERRAEGHAQPSSCVCATAWSDDVATDKTVTSDKIDLHIIKPYQN
jgi:hypothetical protein